MTSAEIDALWTFSDPAASEVRFREALEAAEKPEVQAEIKTQIARTLGLQRRFDEALALLDEVTFKTRRVQVRKALEAGRVHNSSGQKKKSMDYFRQALELSRREPGLEYYAIDAAHMLGIATTGETSLAWNLKAIEMAKKAGDPRARNWLGSLLNNTAWTLHDLSRYDDAYNLFVAAQTFREHQGNDETIRIAKWSVARCLRSMGKIDEAMEIQKALAESGSDDGFISEEMGELLIASGKPDDAKPHFSLAYEKLSKDPWLRANEGDRLKRLAELAGHSPNE